MKIKVYVMHSEKIDYKEEIYKPLLEKGLMKDFFLILPLSEKFKSTYIKDLLNDSDIIICNLSNFNFLANIELKTAKKLNKPIFYYIKKDDKNLNKYNNNEIIVYNTKEEFIDRVTKLLYSLNQKELKLKRDNIYSLGKVENKR